MGFEEEEKGEEGKNKSKEEVEKYKIEEEKEEGKGPCYYCNGENVYQSAVVKCPRCFWCDGYKICPICAHQIPVDRKHSKDGLIWCADCHAVKHIDSDTLKKTHYPPSEDEDDEFAYKHFVVVVTLVCQ